MDETNTLDTSTEAQSVETENETNTDATTEQVAQETTEAQTPEPYVPFKNGKEKFKINGEEVEWDFETAKRYAQIGRSGQLAMQRAAQVEKKSKEFYNQLVMAAKNNPEGLLEILTGQKRQAQQAKSLEQDESDPRDLKIKELEEKLTHVYSSVEKQQLEEERRAIQNELDSAVKMFPNLNDEITQSYVKQQYRNALAQGLNVTIEDVAFHVSQQLKEKQLKSQANHKKILEEKGKKAPVSSSEIPAAGKQTKVYKTMSEIEQLAGLR